MVPISPEEIAEEFESLIDILIYSIINCSEIYFCFMLLYLGLVSIKVIQPTMGTGMK